MIVQSIVLFSIFFFLRVDFHIFYLALFIYILIRHLTNKQKKRRQLIVINMIDKCVLFLYASVQEKKQVHGLKPNAIFSNFHEFFFFLLK